MNQNTNSIYHSALAKRGETQVTIKGQTKRGVSARTNRPYNRATLVIDGEEFAYFCSGHVADKLDQYAGQTVKFKATGSDRDGSDDIAIGAGQQRPQSSGTSSSLRDAKIAIRQLENLYRLCARRGSVIANDLGGAGFSKSDITDTIFRVATVRNLDAAMPVELDDPAPAREPEPEPEMGDEEEDDIPF